MRRSFALFIAAVLVLIWFGDEAFTGYVICVTSCISLAGMTTLELVISVAILPVILVLIGIYLFFQERKLRAPVSENTTRRTGEESSDSESDPKTSKEDLE